MSSSSLRSFDLHLPHSHAALAQLPESCLSVERVFHHLFMCLETPRPSNLEGSKQELALITKKLIEFGEANGLDTAVDEVGNVRLRKKASAGYENATKIVLQSHMDIVCSKTNDSKHDFYKDPITPIIEGNKLHADRTTLGADDGIGVAASMAILEIIDPEFVHGPLEAVFTIDEETTMTGAEFIGKAPFLQSTVMINVDSEEASSICVGCAGGFERQLLLPITREPLASGKVGVSVYLHSLLGGHTGIDIFKGRANALQIVARLLDGEMRAGVQIQLVSLNGGNAPNAIPRDAKFTVAIDADKVELFKSTLETIVNRVKKEFIGIERIPAPDSTDADPKWVSPLVVEVSQDANLTGSSLSIELTKKVIALMLATPHGPIKVAVDMEYAVETSISFSLASLPQVAPIEGQDLFTVHVFSRSSYDSDMADVEARLDAIANLAGCLKTKRFNYFPGWDPKLDSPALKQVIRTHQTLFNSEPRVYSVHAGLECGLFKLAYPDLDCVSIGPTIHHAHSPQEELVLDTVAPFYQWLKQSIVAISKNSIGKQ